MGVDHHLYVGPFIRIKRRTTNRSDFWTLFASHELDDDSLFELHDGLEKPHDETWLLPSIDGPYSHTFGGDDTGWLVGDADHPGVAWLDFRIDHATHIDVLRDEYGGDAVTVEWGVIAYHS